MKTLGRRARRHDNGMNGRGKKPTCRRRSRQSGRKPLGPPIGGVVNGGAIPFHQLPAHLQAAQIAVRRRYNPSDD
ncbi:MAG: hypothetical protein HYT69_00225 [Candidatus Zambryskibacteria bacterium]|nr:hypothetical protein [Candidatus Zambryskibacteria bacterium]